MKRFALLTVVITAVLTLVLPFVGGSGPGLDSTTAAASNRTAPIFATTPIPPRQTSGSTLSAFAGRNAVLASSQKKVGPNLSVDTEHMAQKPVPVPIVIVPPTTSKGGSAKVAAAQGTAQRRAAAAAAGSSCPTGGGGGGSAPGRTSPGGVGGTTTADIQGFSAKFNAIRIANCLQPIPSGNFRYDGCMEQRLFWIAEDPSTDPSSAWGHMGSVRSDGLPSVGCDGNLAGGSGNSGATVAQKWWDSLAHRASLYRPTVTGSTAGVCIYFAMTHGGIPNESASFTRAAARWGGC
ncbi:hypothetical protein [Glaciihabitans sp. UYNi722]|uniref:hypothetical protein n=1 Tax=Glaciihabitans sp. UYNi722 TaxID=3156344 RepID=UPI003390C8A0